MGISKKIVNILGLFRQPSGQNLDGRLLDGWIQDALLDDTKTQPPVGAWERLYKAITERRPVRGYGMWVLDEPLRDPPETPPTLLSAREFQRVLNIHVGRRIGDRRYNEAETMIWSSVVPPLLALAKW